MALESDAPLSILHTTLTRSLSYEVFGTNTPIPVYGTTILDCWDNSRTSGGSKVSAPNYGVHILDFLGHIQYDAGSIECQESMTSFNPVARDNLGNGDTVPATYATSPNPMWEGDPGVTSIVFYRNTSLQSFTAGHGCYVEGYRRTAGSSDSWGAPYLQEAYYTSGQIAIDMKAYDYRFSVEDMP